MRHRGIEGMRWFVLRLPIPDCRLSCHVDEVGACGMGVGGVEELGNEVKEPTVEAVGSEGWTLGGGLGVFGGWDQAMETDLSR